ncbi:rhodanese-like domain-containing protein [Iamia majanohamensis]|uniref:Rhodanese-like domain-containing protein n=1 Tax=Iamia majanohamensis TaxID=467976 RepID=A0AAF0BV17_9ACTN|nr:rhodanese-like domain-containing protein [Iamia majanohamensis]WCO66325.1 rhodanese-like domain-containing protein [Iamia majanohamensis]
MNAKHPRPRRHLRGILLVPVLALLGLAMTGCGDSDDAEASDDPGATSSDGPEPGPDSALASLDEQRTVIDVRTPEEYAEGHVADAQLIDVQDPSFADQIADLPTDDDYVVYCRSGARAATAAEQMRAAGLDVLSGGGLDDMTDAGWPTSP